MQHTAGYLLGRSATLPTGNWFGRPLCRACLGLAALLSSAVPLVAQNNQRLVYVSAGESISGFVVDAGSGTLASISGSPFPEGFDGQAIAVHPSGKFLYVLNPQNDNVSAFQIDPGTGALTQVPGSPFAATSGSAPVGFVIDPSGKFLYELDALVGANGADLYSYSIDQNTGALTAPALSYNLENSEFTAVGLVGDSADELLYVVGNTQTIYGVGWTFQIDPATGNVSSASTLLQSQKQLISAAVSPNGKFWYVGLRQNAGELEGSGTPLFLTNEVQDFPNAMAVDSTNTYLYVWFAIDGLRGFAIDPASGALTELAGSPFVPAGPNTLFVADPTGPFLYSSTYGAFQISPSGALTSIPGFYVPQQNIVGIGTFGPSAPIQPVSGPAVSFLPSSLSFDPQAVGTTSGAWQIAISNSGSQELIINTNGIAITGPNSADFFFQSNSCPPVLVPSQGCAVTIVYDPSTAGPSTASLTISSNVPGGSSVAALSGSGFVPAPAVTLVPGSLSFPDSAEGIASASKSIIVTNSGSAALQIPAGGVILTGANPGDFSQTNTCNNTSVPAQGNCTISVSFQPIAAGARTAQIQIADNAGNSPQSVSLSGNGAAPFAIGSSSATSQTLAAGATAQYDLQLMPASGFTGTILLSCSGAPQGSVCTAPSSVIASGSAALNFVVTVTTTARSVVPSIQELQADPLDSIRRSDWSGFLAGLFFLLLAFRQRDQMLTSLRHRAFGGASIAILLVVSVALISCGGGSPASGGTSPGTPAGSSTLTVTASAGGVVQTFNLTLTVQ